MTNPYRRSRAQPQRLSMGLLLSAAGVPKAAGRVQRRTRLQQGQMVKFCQLWCELPALVQESATPMSVSTAGIVTIHARTSAWVQELSFLREGLRARAREFGVKDVRIMVGAIPRDMPPVRPPPPAPRPLRPCPVSELPDDVRSAALALEEPLRTVVLGAACAVYGSRTS